ncbi:alpha,alpha-trehalase [Oesophagostomum dentatum]|uniref:Trehalase n=1 Tax=Oesophagostomum dentatum TaxID=61180 RepID=A0A0B1TJN5_OESDE|nr:alpha,alpha-trehalase [Oesophagostomum dentatum]
MGYLGKSCASCLTSFRHSKVCILTCFHHSLNCFSSTFSQIYCDGPILKTVQDSYLFPDSKHFVDMSLKFDPSGMKHAKYQEDELANVRARKLLATLRNFDELGEKANDIAVLREFVNAHFNPPGTELVEWFPRDWVDFPSTFLNIHDYHHRRWALHLHRIWRDLCRRVRDDVRRHQDHYSLLYVPHPFIIPGGRFREFYYWDSFWILKGLIFSEMHETARGIIKNLAYMVDNHGFVPNGGRVYYLTRSQPPLLIPMVYDYFLGTGDLEFVMEVLPTLEKEYLFWINKRSQMYVGEDGKEKFPIYQYRATLHVPRPESYREDFELVHHLKNTEGEGRHHMRTIRCVFLLILIDLVLVVGGKTDLVAEKMATSWLTVTYQSFIRTHAMFEKYNVTLLTEEASAGGGGEYEVQKRFCGDFETGFGWTNGVILDLLDKYGDKMKSSSNIASVVLVPVIVFMWHFESMVF